MKLLNLISSIFFNYYYGNLCFFDLQDFLMELFVLFIFIISLHFKFLVYIIEAIVQMPNFFGLMSINIHF